MAKESFLPEQIVNILSESKIPLNHGAATGENNTLSTVNATALNTQFFYKAWLDAKGDIEMVSEYVKAWLEVNATSLKARFVYQAWLDAKGDMELVREHLEVWLRENATATEASFVYKAWLDAQGDIEPVREYLEAWFKVNSTAPEADFVYKAWLDAQGDTELVRKYIKAWLKENATSLDVDFVCKAWLDAKGDVEMVWEHLAAWLKTNATAPNTQFVYKAWLDAKGDKELVREHLAAWLKENATAPDTQFIYKAWLDAKGDIEFICEHLKAWLETNATAPEADFVYKAWLDACGEFAIIKTYAIAWLHENRERENAVYLTKYISKEKDISAATIKDILVWCRRFPENEDALWRLTQLGRHLLNPEIREDVVRTSEIILHTYLSGSYALTPLIRSQINSLFSYLIDTGYFCEGYFRVRIDRLFLAWFRYPGSYGADLRPHINLQRRNYFKRVADFILSGTLDVFVDRKPLERFLSWIALWQPQYKLQLKQLLHLLQNRYPAPGLWDILD